MSESSIVLLAPPILDCTTGPFLGIANIKAYLNDHTRYPVHLLDWNVECLLSRQFFEMLEEYLCFLQRELADNLPTQYSVLLQQVKAICADFHNPDKLDNKVALLQVLFQKLLSQRNFRDIPHLLLENNLYKIWRSFFENKLGELECNFTPRLVGISISFHTQLVPALILAYLLKERFHDVPIVLGGSLFWHLPKIYLEDIVRLTWIDFIVKNEGETPLFHLMLACDGQEQFDKVPNLVWCRDENEVVFNANIPPHSLHSELPPDFGDLSLDSYSNATLPYLLSRGCYWAQCYFCDIPGYTTSGSPRYTAKRPAQVVADIQSLQRNYGNHHSFYLVTTAMPPAYCQAIVQKIEETGTQFEWLTMVRADLGFNLELTRRMYQAGCRYVEMGLESASDRVLRLMNKGITRSTFQTALDNFAASGVRVRVEVIVNFPGTTEEEAWETFEFLKGNLEKIESVNISEFSLNSRCLVAQRPEQFGVKLGERRVDTAFGFDCFTYETTSGMSCALGRETTRRIQGAWMELICGDSPCSPKSLT